MSTATEAESTIAGPGWDLSGEYPAIDSRELEADLTQLESLLDEIEGHNPALEAAIPIAEELGLEAAAEAVAAAQETFKLSERAGKLLHDPYVFANCLLSVDAQNEEAQMLQGRLQGYVTRIGDVLQPLSQFLDRVSDEVIAAYLDDEEVAPSEFVVRHARERRHEILGLDEEKLVGALAQDGIHAWDRLYTQISGVLRCEVEIDGETETMGVAQASSLTQKSDVEARKQAWRAINRAWEREAEPCAAALNAIAGWRLEMCRRRSRTREVHYLDAPAHDNRIARTTLDALMAAAEQGAPLARRGAKAMARAYGLEQIGPWDNRAPAPKLGDAAETAIPFDDGVDLIAGACDQVSPAMGDFVRMMAERSWIEGTVSGHKRPGAYCTGFSKSRTPRVYMTYTGTTTDIMTLAHELGHAYHSWVMRDLPESQLDYGMSLAETASTFAEATVRDALLARAAADQERLDIMWEDVAALPSFVLNIPTRYSFETELYDKRGERPLRPAELQEMMSRAWQRWYGDSLCEPDPWFWASKLHFYIGSRSFYNFPYLFGYLFSTGVYLRRSELGDEFHDRYVALLRDTGRTTAEELAHEHLGVDLGQPDFWLEALNGLEPRVTAFEQQVDKMV
jgi:oligoendopeptidase F